MIDIKISYFYQIRNFLPNMIPLSTAMGDPAWFHNFTYDKNYQFKDKRGIWNGIRAEIFNPSKVKAPDGGCRVCEVKRKNCDFKQKYKEYLDTLDFEDIMQRFYKLNQQIQKQEHTDIDYTFVLIVHEAPSNPCSERHFLIQWFQEHNYPLSELHYPIQN